MNILCKKVALLVISVGLYAFLILIQTKPIKNNIVKPINETSMATTTTTTTTTTMSTTTTTQSEHSTTTETIPSTITAKSTTKAPSTTKGTTKTTKKKITTKTVASSSNGKSLGTFKIVGYSSEEGTVGTVSASGLPLIHHKTCAMNLKDMRRLGIKYGDYITVVGFGRLQVTDCGCGPGKVDIFCNTIKDTYKVTRKAEVLRG